MCASAECPHNESPAEAAVTYPSPESTVPARTRARSHATSADIAPTGMRERLPWRSVSASAVSIGTPLGVGVLHPLLGTALALIEATVALVVIGTALFGSRVLSERAFRLLRWFGNRSEPPSPPDGQSGRRRQSTRFDDQ